MIEYIATAAIDWSSKSVLQPVRMTLLAEANPAGSQAADEHAWETQF
jgi:hypothetical protein